jgi:hypothetical protein
MNEWQPIGTARTTKDVLVYCEQTKEQFVAYWSEIESSWIYASVKGVATIACEPTHWMPLPQPPDKQA